MLVMKELKVISPGCDQSHDSHGDAHSLISGVLGWQDGATLRPVRGVRVFRECLDESGHVVRSCPMKFKVDRKGSFTQDVWRKHVNESICMGGVVTSREYEERLQLRFQAANCEDLVVPFRWPSEPAVLVMNCKR